MSWKQKRNARLHFKVLVSTRQHDSRVCRGLLQTAHHLSFENEQLIVFTFMAYIVDICRLATTLTSPVYFARGRMPIKCDRTCLWAHAWRRISADVASRYYLHNRISHNGALACAWAGGRAGAIARTRARDPARSPWHAPASMTRLKSSTIR